MERRFYSLIKVAGLTDLLTYAPSLYCLASGALISRCIRSITAQIFAWAHLTGMNLLFTRAAGEQSFTGERKFARERHSELYKI